MRKTLGSLILAALVVAATPVLAADAPAAAATTIPAAAPGHYSVTATQVGKMLDDPAADALLKKMIPTVYANDMFHTMGRDNTLQGIQQFEPEALSDAVLAKVQAELNKLPAKQ